MDNATEVAKKELAKTSARSLQNLIYHYLKKKPTEEELERVWSIYHKIIKLDPKYSFLKTDICMLYPMPPGVAI